jgi:molybdenum cofactor synthesis domain-containing protein
MSRTAAALVIGNELLSGKIREANLYELAQMLRSLGIRLERALMILDDLEIIAREVRALSESYDFVFTSGGIGPTHDDMTIDAVAHAFGVGVSTNPEMEAMLREHHGERLKEGHLRVARVPTGATQIKADKIKWPVTVFNNVWILPGVPQIFKIKLEIIRERLGVDRPFVSRAVFSNLDEGTLKPMLDEVVAEYPAVDVGSYPTWEDLGYKTKLTFDGKDADAVEIAVQTFVAKLPEGEPLRIE